MANKFDLKTKIWRNITTSAATIIDPASTAIQADKTRFLTYIRVDRLPLASAGANITGLEVAIACHATSGAPHSSLASADYVKLLLRIVSVITGAGSAFESDALLSNEVKGSIEEPILSVAGGNFMMLSNSSDVSIAVFAQYYDA